MTLDAKSSFATNPFLQTVKSVEKDHLVNCISPQSNLIKHVTGLVNQKAIERYIRKIQDLNVDEYVEEIITPIEKGNVANIKDTLHKLGICSNIVDDGALYSCLIDMEHGEHSQQFGVIAQNRVHSNGAWTPAQHIKASNIVRTFSRQRIPILTFVDTPGAHADSKANLHNQAHSISLLIAEMMHMGVPSIGIIYGQAYSGGAIPLLSTNIILSVKRGIFNTIQPRGLAGIARQYNLSWQESARYAGINSYELIKKGTIDGIIDWDPTANDDDMSNLKSAIVSSLLSIENSIKDFAKENKDLVVEEFKHQLDQRIDVTRPLKIENRFNFGNETGVCDTNIFGLICSYLRYISIKHRISHSTVERYGRLAKLEVPQGDLTKRLEQQSLANFDHWSQSAEKIIYITPIKKAWDKYKKARSGLLQERGKIASILLGEPETVFMLAKKNLCFEVSIYLYNHWKTDAIYNLKLLCSKLKDRKKEESCTLDDTYQQDDASITLLQLLNTEDLIEEMLGACENILIFDHLYDNILKNLKHIAADSTRFHRLDSNVLERLIDSSLVDDSASSFSDWLKYFAQYRHRGEFLTKVEEWKSALFCQMPEVLLVLITFFLETLLPSYLKHKQGEGEYDGSINPGKIGKKKDFWYQLDIAYRDLLIQHALLEEKKKKRSLPQDFIDKFFINFESLHDNLMTSNPIDFPGFRLSIEKTLNQDAIPCGMITGIGSLKIDSQVQAGVCISNLAFQAGAFDMASAEKMARLITECAERRLPIFCFCSSGGMQTKEGPNALFSMSIINDLITRFTKDCGLPLIVFGFGDCTGGSQASFVTHPLAKTYYFSGTDMPFAGRVVVPSFLPSSTTVSNYLSAIEGSMHGLVKHPFAEDLDKTLRAIDPHIPIPQYSVEDILKSLIDDDFTARTMSIGQEEPLQLNTHKELLRPIKTLMIHARGCTATKITRIAHKMGINVILAQSDPDMNSYVADIVRKHEGSSLVCLGGQTSDESYLNARSIIAIAERYQADSLHPGIGFLSENADFADLCRTHNLNFIGPSSRSMEIMGNKSNAINTARKAGVSIAPGSHGVLTSAEATEVIAKKIGYPVLLKAVHGGGGKGIKKVSSPGDIKSAFLSAQAEARAAFSNGDLYLEKCIESFRHIEIQILRDSHGNTKILGLRDCSVQRDNQKIIEESDSALLTEELREQACTYARDLSDAADYMGAGTVEFIFDLSKMKLYFMEMNTRLQVEHPVTEATSGINIIEQQLRIAKGESIAELSINKKPGYAMEVRITAEKIVRNTTGTCDFIPTPGLVTTCHLPEREGFEIIQAMDKNKTIPPFYDSMVAQIICHSSTRDKAIKKLKEYLVAIKIEGISTNIPLLQRILEDKAFIESNYDTSYLSGLFSRIDLDSLVQEMQPGKEQQSQQTDIEIVGSAELKVLSPSAGIYYSSPSPLDPSYINIGSTISLDAILCQIEAMKIFSHISLTSINNLQKLYPDQSYEIMSISQVNGSQLSAGDLLFIIKPIKKI